MPHRTMPKRMRWYELPEVDPRAPREGHDDLRDGFISYGDAQASINDFDESDLPEYGNRGYVETPTRAQLRPEDYERD